MRFFRYILSSILLLTSILAGFPAGNGWRLYPAFDNNPMKIAAGPRYTYFLVFPQYYNMSTSAGADGYRGIHMKIFVHDSQNPTAGIVPLSDLYDLSGADVRVMEYNPATLSLMVAYTNGALDVIYDSGRVLRLTDLKVATEPGISTVNGITPVPGSGDAWIATDAGYAYFSNEAGRFTEINDIHTPLHRVFRLGNKLAAIRDNKFYEADISRPIRSFDDFSEVTFQSYTDMGSGISNRRLVYAYTVMPLSDTAVAMLTRSTNGTSTKAAISLICLNPETKLWTARALAHDTFTKLDATKIVGTQWDNTAIANRDGFLVPAAGAVYQVCRDGAQGLVNATGNVPEGMVRSANLTRTNRLALGSWDNENFWEYYDRGTFARSTKTGSGAAATWTNIFDQTRPAAPAAYRCRSIIPTRNHGLLAVNHGAFWGMSNQGVLAPALLSCFADEKWTQVSPPYVRPNSTIGNDNLYGAYRNGIIHFPLNDPLGMVEDPLAPGKIIMGSLSAGLAIFDLDNPAADILHFTSPNDTFKDFPGSVLSFPEQGWSRMNVASYPTVDYNNVMWTCYFHYDHMNQVEDRLRLYYWTPGRRLADYGRNTADVEPLPYISLNLDCSTMQMCRAVGLRKYENRNKLVLYPGSYDNPIFIYDYNGTPEQTWDDVMIEIKAFVTPNGYRHAIPSVFEMVEDPVTGRVWITGSEALLSFNPCAPVVKGEMAAEKLTLRSDHNDEDSEAILESSQINNISFDEYGRMWIATENHGVWGINRERNGIVAHYNTSNSPLPSDHVAGTGWDEVSKSLFISTESGMARVHPDFKSDHSEPSATMPYAIPAHVTRHYAGNITLHNIPASARIAVRDRKGSIVANLGSTSTGSLHWDMRDKNGNYVTSGLYKVSDTAGAMPDFDIVIIR